jgi:flagellar hook-associated protein 2
MSIQSLGVGSGLALDSLVNQLIAAERAPKQARLDRRQESLDTEISAIGTLKSKLNEFLDSVESINDQLSDTGRKPTISNPNELIEPFTAEAASGANQGAYAIAVTQLASGSRIETDDADSGGFSSSTDSVLSSGSGTLTFKIDSSGDTFTINVSAGDTLDDLRDAINDASDNFGVSANLIDTGTPEGGVKLVITSDTTGAGNDLVIVNDNNLAELQKVSTTDSTETDTYLTPVESAKNAKATIDGIAVESATNTFENTIADVSLTVKELSSKDASDNFETSTLTIGNVWKKAFEHLLKITTN